MLIRNAAVTLGKSNTCEPFLLIGCLYLCTGGRRNAGASLEQKNKKKHLNRTFSVVIGESRVNSSFFIYFFWSLYMISNVMHTENEQKAGEMFHLAKNPEGQFCVKWSICQVGTKLGIIPSCPWKCSSVGFLFLCARFYLSE